MCMRSVILILFIVFTFLSSSAQCVSIELNIKWRKKLFFEVEGIDTTTFRPAFLNITYRNTCDYPVYFFRMADENQYLPNAGSPSLGTYSPRLHYAKYPEARYIVMLRPSRFNPYWGVGVDTFNLDKSYSRKDINEYIFEIHNYLYETTGLPKQTLKSKSGGEQYLHEYSDITEDTIKGNSISRFIFLDTYESYTESYSLIGFQLLGGTYTFKLLNDEMLDYVNTTQPLGSGKTGFIEKRLPEQVGEFKLYRGNYLSNQVTVYFPGVSAPNNSIRQKE